MTTIASSLRVARSNLITRQTHATKPRRQYGQAGDSRLLPLIRQLAEERQSYGYRRITALLNRRRERGNLTLKTMGWFCSVTSDAKPTEHMTAW